MSSGLSEVAARIAAWIPGSTLDLKYLELTEVPSNLPAELEVLDLSSNSIEALPDALPAGLKRLFVCDNRLTYLPSTLPSTLIHIAADDNELVELPTLPDSIDPHHFGLFTASNKMIWQWLREVPLK